MPWRIQFLLTFVVCVLTHSLISAQVTASISGKVIGEHRTALQRADVTLTNSENEISRWDITDRQGAFSLQELKPGKHEIEVCHEGYCKRLADLPLTIGKNEVVILLISFQELDARLDELQELKARKKNGQLDSEHLQLTECWKVQKKRAEERGDRRTVIERLKDWAYSISPHAGAP